MDLLFDNGYVYMPDSTSNWTEINEAVIHGDVQKIKYLLQRGLPVDNKNLSLAIEQNSMEMVYIFIASGATTNAVLANHKTYLDLALQYDNPEAIVLLLACGMAPDESYKIAMQNKYTHKGMQKIFTTSLQMQHTFLKIPRSIELNDATGEVLSDYAKHNKLAHQLDGVVTNVIITRDNKVIATKDIMANILEIFNTHPLDDKFNLSEKAELESVLEYFYPGLHNKRGYAEKKLAETTHAALQLADQLSVQPANQINRIDVVNAQLIVENIATLSFELDIQKLPNDTEVALKKIINYLEQHHIKTSRPNSNNLFFSLNTTRHPSSISYDEDVKTPLQICNDSLRQQ
jgi:hypothetical protein